MVRTWGEMQKQAKQCHQQWNCWTRSQKRCGTTAEWNTFIQTRIDEVKWDENIAETYGDHMTDKEKT